MEIFVSNIPLDAEADDLAEWLRNYGEVTQARVVRDPDTGRSRRYGFVSMPCESEAQKAIAELNHCFCEGRVLSVQESRKVGTHNEQRQDDRRARTVYVGNLAYELSQAEVFGYFAAFGSVQDVYVPMRNGRPRGMAFITYADVADAQAAIARANGTELHGRRIACAFTEQPPRKSRAA